MGRPRRSPLERRLLSGELTAQDKQDLALARQVRKLRQEGATILECARLTGSTERRLQQWMKRSTYAALDAYLGNLEGDAPADEQVEEIVRTAKSQFAQFAPDAIDYYKECFARNPVEEQIEKGTFKDDAKAMWATDKVSKGLGLTEPEHAVRPVINIQHAYIRHETNLVQSDDAEAVAASKAIDVTPERDAI